MIHIYCGDGKGKTTAAFGLAARASEGGFAVIAAQFLKARPSGEVIAIGKLPNVTLLKADIPEAFSWNMTPQQRTAATAAHNDLIAQAKRCSRREGKIMLLLDELLGAMSAKLIDSEAVMDFLREQAGNDSIEIVITGRGPSEELLELADYVTEMKKIKHPFDKGVGMRKGIEY
ncbi:MAG: cob(I)yrinic acid a,c-diamide adenosyltransferase [Angelakisella sp.]